MAFDLNTIIRGVFVVLLFASAGTLLFLFVPFLRRVKSERKATAKTIAAWFGGITAVGSLCVSALSVKLPIGVLPEGDPAVAAIQSYFAAIQARDCAMAWDLVHAARKDTLAKEFRGFGQEQFCKAYQTTRTYENLQILRRQDTAGVGGARVYRVAYDVKDEFPNNRFFFELRSKTVAEALRKENVNEREVFERVTANLRRYYDVPDADLPRLREVIGNMPVVFIFAPELITETTRLLRLNYGIEWKEKAARPSRQEVNRHFVHSLVMLEEGSRWKIRDGLSYPELAVPYTRIDKPL
jgi:hypothetical protein